MNTFKIIITVIFLINSVYSFDCNMIPIINKIFMKNTCNKKYVTRGEAIRNRRTSNNQYKMINLRNSTNVSKETDEFSKYLGNTRT